MIDDRNGRESMLAVSGAILALVVTTALAAVVGMLPTAIAQAAPPDVPVRLGIGARTVDVTAEAGPVADKAASLAGSGMTLSCTLASPAAKKPTPVRRPAPVPRPKPTATSRSSSGSGWSAARVSWYGPGFYGNTMAGGGTLTPDSMIVAHRSLPFGTRVQFEYGGRTCTVVVQDRGPYVGGRTFDLGPGTAKALGFSGVRTVRYRILGR